MNILKPVLCALVFAVPFALCAQQIQGIPEAMLTVKVIDEDGQPVEGAHVGMGFDLLKNAIAKPGLSDREGNYSARSVTFGSITYGATKNGYYPSFGDPFSFSGEPQNGRWMPWNPTLTVVVKKIINPVPMYAKRVQAEIPVENMPVGFDLQEGDWVAPHGKGRVADFAFHLTRRFASRKDYECRLRLAFANQYDGIQSVFAASQYGSNLRLPHNVPANGYEPVWERTDSYSNSVPVRGDQNYFFRVRTLATDGKIRKALYGKIHGEIRFDIINSKTAIIIFTYYLNPDGTQNVEFDQKRNLFLNLRPREMPRLP